MLRSITTLSGPAESIGPCVACCAVLAGGRQSDRRVHVGYLVASMRPARQRPLWRQGRAWQESAHEQRCVQFAEAVQLDGAPRKHHARARHGSFHIACFGFWVLCRVLNCGPSLCVHPTCQLDRASAVRSVVRATGGAMAKGVAQRGRVETRQTREGVLDEPTRKVILALINKGALDQVRERRDNQADLCVWCMS